MCPPKDIIDHTMTQIVIFRDNTIWKKENLTQNPLNYIKFLVHRSLPQSSVVQEIDWLLEDESLMFKVIPRSRTLTRDTRAMGAHPVLCHFFQKYLALSHRSQARNAFGRKLARLACAWQGVILEAFPGRVPPWLMALGKAVPWLLPVQG